jgi:hypothetical protein
MTRHVLCGAALLLMVGVGPAFGQVMPPPPVPVPVPTIQEPPDPELPPAGEPVDYVFPTGAGMLLFHVAPAKAADFEAVLARLKEALTKADSPARKFQATNWMMYKSAEKPGDAVVFLFLFDPAMTTANYDPMLLLAEMLPAEVQGLYARMKDAVLRIERMALTKIR